MWNPGREEAAQIIGRLNFQSSAAASLRREDPDRISPLSGTDLAAC